MNSVVMNERWSVGPAAGSLRYSLAMFIIK
jgi:hypothetical protein